MPTFEANKSFIKQYSYVRCLVQIVVYHWYERNYRPTVQKEFGWAVACNPSYSRGRD
jgi:hypothetical protein